MTETHEHRLTASVKNLSNCHVCLKLNPIESKKCSTCQSRLHSAENASVQSTLALLLTGFILYLPANLLPIMYTKLLGQESANTILGGVIVLWQGGSYPIAIIIFIASVLIPIGKILSLLWLCYGVTTRSFISYKKNHQLYRVTEFIGRWSMVDVFVVAILVALIQMGKVMSIYPGLAAVSFAGMVITTMMAAMTFDTRLIWKPRQQVKHNTGH